MEDAMGIVITFPKVHCGNRDSRGSATQSESATIVILPVIRIERFNDRQTVGVSEESSSWKMQ